MNLIVLCFYLTTAFCVYTLNSKNRPHESKVLCAIFSFLWPIAIHVAAFLAIIQDEDEYE